MKDEFTDEEKRGFYKAIYSRRDVRSHFIPKPIEEEKLSKILHARSEEHKFLEVQKFL